MCSRMQPATQSVSKTSVNRCGTDVVFSPQSNWVQPSLVSGSKRLRSYFVKLNNSYCFTACVNSSVYTVKDIVSNYETVRHGGIVHAYVCRGVS